MLYCAVWLPLIDAEPDASAIRKRKTYLMRLILSVRVQLSAVPSFCLFPISRSPSSLSLLSTVPIGWVSRCVLAVLYGTWLGRYTLGDRSTSIGIRIVWMETLLDIMGTYVIRAFL